MTDQARMVWKHAFGSESEGIDFSGKLIKKAAYGDENSSYGWNIDHVWPIEENGSDGYENLQPVAILTNQQKADKMNGLIKWKFDDNYKTTNFSVAKNIFYNSKKNSKKNGIIRVDTEDSYFYFYDCRVYRWYDNNLYYGDVIMEKSGGDEAKIVIKEWCLCDYDSENNCWKQ